MRDATHDSSLSFPGRDIDFAAIDKLFQRFLHDIFFISRPIPYVGRNPKNARAEFFFIANRAVSRRRRLLPSRETGAGCAREDEAGEEVLRVCRPLAESGHSVEVVLRCDIARRHNDLELNKVCDVEYWWFAPRNAGSCSGQSNLERRSPSSPL